MFLPCPEKELLKWKWSDMARLEAYLAFNASSTYSSGNGTQKVPQKFTLSEQHTQGGHIR